MRLIRRALRYATGATIRPTMAAYEKDRRATAVPRLTAITKNEATEATDVARERTYERAREEIADDLRRQREGTKKKSFADLMKKK